MTTVTASGARATLRHADFRRLLGARLISQTGDGVFQSGLLYALVFLPERQSSLAGFAAATALLLLPFSLVGPFAGVFVDRWRRRRILELIPLVRAVVVLLTVPALGLVATFAGALAVFSLNRLYLATLTAVTPRVVPEEDLLTANSLSGAGGAVATFAGLALGSQLAGLTGVGPLLAVCCVCWVTAAVLAWTLSSDLAADRSTTASLGTAITRVVRELIDGARELLVTPAALIPITAVSVLQFLQALVMVVTSVTFRDQLDYGLATFSWLLAAGGVGLFGGFVTVTRIARRVPSGLLLGLASLLCGLAMLPAMASLGLGTLLLGGLLLGVGYAWAKVPADTLVQEAVPDVYRGRVFTLYDLATNSARVLAAFLALPLLPALGIAGCLALAAVLFVAWAPVVPWWLPRAGRPTAGAR